jgi:hypothetical protein
VTRARFCLGVAGVVALEAAWFALRPPGARLRPFVDVLAVEGLGIALVGAFLVADRPFLAAREMAGRMRRAEGEGPENAERDDEPPRRRAGPVDRRAGAVALLVGGALFGVAALLWALGGAA